MIFCLTSLVFTPREDIIELIYLNGKITSAADVGISPSDQGFLYGAGLFETMRAYEGCIFLLESHLHRLISSASAIGIEGLDVGKLDEACRSVVAANRLDSARVRLTVSTGPETLFSTSKIPTIMARAIPYTPPLPDKYHDGYRATVSSLSRFSQSILVRHKTTSRLDCVMARAQANAMGFDEALFLNENGNLTEGSVSNLFLIGAYKTLMTPPLGDGLLPGITRQLVLELSTKSGLRIVEKSISLKDLESVDEAFITNSLIEIMPLASITDDGHKYVFRYGAVTSRLMKAYREAVDQTIR
jgi:branched-subunit amino acid aminotransferase/4-amino-4-deoxychorismate lyase